MAIRFNADEIFRMAERSEANAAELYRHAARMFQRDADVDFLLRIALMEDRHQATFAAMRAALPPALNEEGPYDPYLEATLYLDALAGGHGGEGAVAPAQVLTGQETLAAVLQLAISLEQKAIAFYVGLRDMVPEHLGRDKVETIIVEEQSHVVIMARELRRLAPA